MKRVLLFLCCLFCAISFIRGESRDKVIAYYKIIPLPQFINEKKGKPFVLDGNTRIVYQKGNEVQKRTAEFLAEYISLSTGLTLKVTDRVKRSNCIILKCGYRSKNTESYNLLISNKNIIINGSDEAGIFYGVQTLRKSLPVTDSICSVILPAVDIKDHPRFHYRGMHLDVCRHMFSVEFIKRYIDILALHNINKLHWHITDDQGWRIEIKKYPELKKKGSIRASTIMGRNAEVYDGKPYGGFYTKAGAKEIVAYAKERFITVIPEIDLPGHTLAVLATYPNLGCTGGPYEVSRKWGIFADVLCAGNEDIYTFLNDVFDEIVDIFPSEYIHIGGDECLKNQWEICPKCQRKIKELGYKNDKNSTAEQKLQSYVMNRVGEYIKSKNRKIIGWDEIQDGEIIPDVTIMSWRGKESAITAARHTNDVIIVPTSHLYFDYYQSKETENEPLGIGGYIPVEKVYGFEPMPVELTSEQQKYIIGLQANLWTEYISDEEHVEYMILPRLAALSEVQWTMPERKDYNAFLPHLATLMNLYERLDFNFATHIFDIKPIIVSDAVNKQVKITLSTFDKAPIYYTTDGSIPDEKSLLYQEPLMFKSSVILNAIAIRGEDRSRVFSKRININKATFKKVMLENKSVPKYTYKGNSVLVDGLQGSNVYSTGEWLGFSQDFIAVVDLEDIPEISKVRIRTFIDVLNWIAGATYYEVYVSSDNESFKKVYERDCDPLQEDTFGGQKYLEADFAPEKARYVKIVAKSLKSLPEWSSGSGKPAAMFVDEIIVN